MASEITITSEAIIVPRVKDLTVAQAKDIISVVQGILWTPAKREAMAKKMAAKWTPEKKAAMSKAMKGVL